MSRKVFRRSVTETSTTLSDLGEIGDKRFEDGKTYRLVYTAVSQEDDAILALDSADSALSSYQVQVAPASTSLVFGINATGATIATGSYFWAQVEGYWAAGSAVFDTDADVSAESPLVLNSDIKVGSVLATDLQPFGTSLVSVTSVSTDKDDSSTYGVYLKAGGS
jgi:hypothetical protein